ncbi:MAG: hypothetical protein ABIU84_13180 [Thermoanaerobaculia bacterium]
MPIHREHLTLRLTAFVRWALCALLLAASADSAIAQEPDDGELDPSFSGDGKDVLVAGVSGDFAASEVLVAPDGALVVVGRRTIPGGNLKSWVWARATNAGFSSYCPFTPPGSTDVAGRPPAAFDSQGRLVIAGGVTIGSSVVGGAARFLYPACVLDPSFGDEGFQVVDVTPASEAIYALAIDAQDRPFLAGIYLTATLGDTLVVALNEDGSPRTTGFGTNGWVRFDVFAAQRTEVPTELFVQPDGKIVLAGILDSTVVDPLEIYVLRLLPDGEPDPDFGLPADDGTVLVSFAPASASVMGMAFDFATGRLALAGQYSVSGQPGQAAMAVLLASGALDDSFSFDGKKNFLLAGGITSSLTGVAFDGLGRLLVGGSANFGNGSNYEFAAARLFDDGQFDITFGAHGSVTIPFDIGNPGSDNGSALTFQAGRPVVAGTVFAPDDRNKMGLARLATALIFADGFNGGNAGGWQGK